MDENIYNYDSSNNYITKTENVINDVIKNYYLKELFLKKIIYYFLIIIFMN